MISQSSGFGGYEAPVRMNSADTQPPTNIIAAMARSAVPYGL